MVGIDRHPTVMRSVLKTSAAARRIFSVRRTAKRDSAFWLVEGTSHRHFFGEDSLVRFTCLTDQVWQILSIVASPALPRPAEGAFLSVTA